MKNLNFGKVIFILGALLSLIGLTYTLGYTDSVYFQYAFSIGIVLFGIGVLTDGIEKKKAK